MPRSGGGRAVRIGNGCGFWGDNLDAPVLLAEGGQLDYLTLEYLAELTMSILALQKQRKPELGYAGDFLDVLERLTPTLRAQPHLKIITNAGGMNPPACAARARAILDQAGLHDRRIAVVTGDDLLPSLDQLIAQGQTFANLDTGTPLAAVRPRVVSANAYLGSRPIVDALRWGAEVVITGRVADACLTVAPAVHEFDWPWDDWDRLSAGSAAGHLIECGAQATGGLWCNWQDLDDLAGAGYPIAAIEPDGTFTLTKPPNTGGAVNRETVSEQLLYEVGDPSAYLTPDVTADFTSLALSEPAHDVVRVEAARGKPATDSYKVSIAYRDGYAASGTLVIAGPGAAAKARRCGEIILERLRRAGVVPEQSLIECLGAGDSLPSVLPANAEAPEVVLRVAVRDRQKAVVERFTKELAPLVTSGPPGVTGYTTGRPTVREVFAYWPALVPKRLVTPEVRVFGADRPATQPPSRPQPR
jgi:Acyclic terpene utilisation family protein AtuA